MKHLIFAIAFMVCVATPTLGQEVIFEDDFEVDTGLWCTYYDYSPSDERAVDPLDPTNSVLRPGGVPNGGGVITYTYMSVWSAPIPVDMASTYVLSFRVLDESPEFQNGSVTLRDGEGDPFDPNSTESYAMPFPLIADGSWHDYSVEFTPGELFASENGVIVICLTGPEMCRVPVEWLQYGLCEGETNVYYDDFRVERMASIPNESTSWGRVKALFR